MSMVEKVARALALAALDPETRAVVNIEAHMAHVAEHYEELARAAIAAMREPTPEMIEAGAIVGRGVLLRSGYPANALRDFYAAMIDAALSDN